MAKKNNTLSFKDSYISLEENTITEHLTEGEVTHVLSDVLETLKDKKLTITFKEAQDVVFGQE